MQTDHRRHRCRHDDDCNRERPTKSHRHNPSRPHLPPPASQPAPATTAADEKARPTTEQKEETRHMTLQTWGDGAPNVQAARSEGGDAAHECTCWHLQGVRRGPPSSHAGRYSVPSSSLHKRWLPSAGPPQNVDDAGAYMRPLPPPAGTYTEAATPLAARVRERVSNAGRR